ncbi:MAG: hypothetical protein ABWX73_09320 [Marmoricola sp.]
MKLRALAVPTAGLALLVLSGCSGTGLTPGTATEINGTRITTSRVSDVAAAQCDLRDVLTKQQLAPAVTAAQVNREALSLLMDTELTKQYGKSKDIAPDKLIANAYLGQVQSLFKDLPSDSKSLLNDVFTTWADGRSILVQAGSDSTGEKPDGTNLDKLLQAGLTERETWLKKADITTDPRYGPDKDGYPSRDSASVSKARSTFAVDAQKETPDPAFLGELPPNQKCG